MYAIYTGREIGRFEEDDEAGEFVGLNEALEMVRQLKEDRPDLYNRIASLRDGIRCGRRAGQPGTIVFCRAGRYRQLYLLDERGEVASRDMGRILSLLRCEPETPAEPLPVGHPEAVAAIKRRFEQEVQARRAEREHTLPLTRAQQYVLRELRVLYDGAGSDEDLRAQIARLEAVFRQLAPRPAVRRELNRLWHERVGGLALLEALSQIYSLYGLETQPTPRETVANENEELPRVVCSEALIG